MREKKKNKRNNKKKGKVRIIAGVMTREQDSDSTLPPEGEKRRIGVSSPCRMGGGMNILSPHHSEPVVQPAMSPQEVVCSFCGVATHGHRDCPVLHQYIREQADALAEMRLNEYRQLQGWDNYESQKPIPPAEGPLQRGGGPHGGGVMPGHEHPTQKTQKAEGQAKARMIGSMYPHVVKSVVPGGGEGPPPPGRGGPLPADEMEGKEDDEGDTDEETVSVTSSSQGSADKIKYWKWGKGEPVYRSSAGGPPEDPNDPSGEGDIRESRRGPRGHRGQRGRTGPPGRDGALDLWDLLAPEDFLEEMGYLPLWDPLPLQDWGYHQSLMLI